MPIATLAGGTGRVGGGRDIRTGEFGQLIDERLALLTEQLGSSQAALGKLSEITHQQAAIMAYNDAFHFVGIALAISMLAVLLTRTLPAGATGGAAH